MSEAERRHVLQPITHRVLDASGAIVLALSRVSSVASSTSRCIMGSMPPCVTAYQGLDWGAQLSASVRRQPSSRNRRSACVEERKRAPDDESWQPSATLSGSVGPPYRCVVYTRSSSAASDASCFCATARAAESCKRGQQPTRGGLSGAQAACSMRHWGRPCAWACLRLLARLPR